MLAGGDHARAGPLLEEAVSLARAVGDQRVAALALNNLGDLALTVGDYERAKPLFEESLALLEARGDAAPAPVPSSTSAWSRSSSADCELLMGVSVKFSVAEQVGDTEDIAWCLEGYAAIAAAQRHGERAALLLGAAGALLDGIGAQFSRSSARSMSRPVRRRSDWWERRQSPKRSPRAPYWRLRMRSTRRSTAR